MPEENKQTFNFSFIAQALGHLPFGLDASFSPLAVRWMELADELGEDGKATGRSILQVYLAEEKDPLQLTEEDAAGLELYIRNAQQQAQQAQQAQINAAIEDNMRRHMLQGGGLQGIPVDAKRRR